MPLKKHCKFACFLQIEPLAHVRDVKKIKTSLVDGKYMKHNGNLRDVGIAIEEKFTLA